MLFDAIRDCFRTYLTLQKDYGPNTLVSYGDTFRILLRWALRRVGPRPVLHERLRARRRARDVLPVLARGGPRQLRLNQVHAPRPPEILCQVHDGRLARGCQHVPLGRVRPPHRLSQMCAKPRALPGPRRLRSREALGVGRRPVPVSRFFACVGAGRGPAPPRLRPS